MEFDFGLVVSPFKEGPWENVERGEILSFIFYSERYSDSIIFQLDQVRKRGRYGRKRK